MASVFLLGRERFAILVTALATDVVRNLGRCHEVAFVGGIHEIPGSERDLITALWSQRQAVNLSFTYLGSKQPMLCEDGDVLVLRQHLPEDRVIHFRPCVRSG